MPVVEPSLLVAIGLSALMWVVAALAVGWWMARRPAAAFAHDGPVTRLRAFEKAGRADVYERRLRVSRWKDVLPEAGGLFGELSKRHLPPGGRDASLERFAAETRRAERTHWTVLLAGPLALLWSPLWLALLGWALAVACNLPFIVVQRSNRARVERLRRRAQAPGSGSTPGSASESGA